MSLFTYNYYGLFVNTDTEYTDTIIIPSHTVEYTEENHQRILLAKLDILNS